MPQPLQLLEQCASCFNPVLHGEALWIFSYVLLHRLQGAGQNEGRSHPVFSVYAIFYILPSDPRLTCHLSNVSDSRLYKLAWQEKLCLLANPTSTLQCPHWGGYSSPFLWSPTFPLLLAAVERESFSKLPAISHTLSPWTKMVVRTPSGIRTGYI